MCSANVFHSESKFSVLTIILAINTFDSNSKFSTTAQHDYQGIRFTSCLSCKRIICNFQASFLKDSGCTQINILPIEQIVRGTFCDTKNTRHLISTQSVFESFSFVNFSSIIVKKFLFRTQLFNPSPYSFSTIVFRRYSSPRTYNFLKLSWSNANGN